VRPHKVSYKVNYIQLLGSAHHSSSESPSESKWSVPDWVLKLEQFSDMHLHASVQLSPYFLQEHLLLSHFWHLQLTHSMTAVGAGETSNHLMTTSESVTTQPWPIGHGVRGYLDSSPSTSSIWQPDSWPTLYGSGLHSGRVVACRGQSSVCRTFCALLH